MYPKNKTTLPVGLYFENHYTQSKSADNHIVINDTVYHSIEPLYPAD